MNNEPQGTSSILQSCYFEEKPRRKHQNVVQCDETYAEISSVPICNANLNSPVFYSFLLSLFENSTNNSWSILTTQWSIYKMRLSQLLFDNVNDSLLKYQNYPTFFFIFWNFFMSSYLRSFALFLLLPLFQLHEEEMCEQRLWEELTSFRVTLVGPVIPQRDKYWRRRRKKGFGVDMGTCCDRFISRWKEQRTQVIRDLKRR